MPRGAPIQARRAALLDTRHVRCDRASAQQCDKVLGVVAVAKPCPKAWLWLVRDATLLAYRSGRVVNIMFKLTTLRGAPVRNGDHTVMAALAIPDDECVARVAHTFNLPGALYSLLSLT